MVLLHREPADHDDANDALHVLHPHGKASAMDRVLARPLPEHELRRERALVPLVLVVQRPRARAPAQDGRALARDPGVVVWERAAPARAVEEQLRAVRERDVYDRGLRGRCGLEAGAQARPELPGGVGCEVGEDAARLLGCDLVELCE